MKETKDCWFLLTVLAVCLATGCSTSTTSPTGQVPNDNSRPGGAVLAGSLVPFTHELREEFRLRPEDLPRLQFVVSDPVTLTRDLPRGEKQDIVRGVLKRVGNTATEEILIDARTPCRPLSAGERTVDVRFNPSFPNAILRFGNESPGKNQGRYHLFADRWLSPGGDGTVTYDGVEYRAINNSGAAYLLVGQQGLAQFESRRRKEPGELIPELQK